MEKRRVVDPTMKAIKAYGGKCFKTDGNYKPDIVGCVFGKAIVIECKDNNKLDEVTEGQEIELNSWRKSGAIALAIDDVNDVIQVLEELRKEYANR